MNSTISKISTQANSQANSQTTDQPHKESPNSNTAAEEDASVTNSPEKTLNEFCNEIDELLSIGSKVIVGKTEQLKLALCCLLAGGHLLIEDQPGVGKTTLAQLLSKLVGLEFQRLQFTSDMLPAEIIGAAIYDKPSGTFLFHKGPIFTHLLLADEINRATPRAQSALLEAMEEQQVTAEGQTYALPSPFFVISTQNPKDQLGTFQLPESQLDRFLMRISIGYPDAASERELLAGENRREILQRITPILDQQQLLDLQKRVSRQQVTEPLIDYIQKLLAHSRISNEFAGCLSPRAGLGLLQAAKAWALFERRNHVIPEDVQAVLEAVTAHRLGASSSNAQQSARQGAELTRMMVEAVPIP